MFAIIKFSPLDKSITSVFMIALILFVRKYLNIKYGSMILCTILFAYLLIPYSLQINLSRSSCIDPNGYLYELLEIVGYYYNIFIKTEESILYKNKRLIVALLLVPYVLIQIVKTTKAVGRSKVINNNEVMDDCFKLFNLKIKVQIMVMVNDNLKVPITYGIIKPKIITKLHD